MENISLQDKLRIVQELVPGKQITLMHIIANPDDILYQKLGLDTSVDYNKGAIGVMTVAIKSSGAEIGFVDRFSGTLIVTGTVSSVQAAFDAVSEYTKNTLGYEVCKITKT